MLLIMYYSTGVLNKIYNCLHLHHQELYQDDTIELLLGILQEFDQSKTTQTNVTGYNRLLNVLLYY